MPSFPKHPERRPAIVTGASSGIGAATARTLGRGGYPVVLGARRVDRCKLIAEEIRSSGGEAVAIELDIAEMESIQEFAAQATREVGEIEIVVSNAGRSGTGSAHEADPEDFAKTIAVNLLGPQQLTRLFVPPMIERGRGDIVFVTSETVQAPRPGAAAYVASKWGQEGLARAIQMELEGTGVRACIIRPGQTTTEMGSDWDRDEATAILESWIHFGLARHGGFLRPEGVANAILAAVSVPRGTHLAVIEVQPEAPRQGAVGGGA